MIVQPTCPSQHRIPLKEREKLFESLFTLMDQAPEAEHL